MEFPDKAWWQLDEYNLSGANDGPRMDDASLWGPQGPALVQLWNDGKTGPGWGRDEFMRRYKKLEFAPRRVLYGYDRGAWNFAWIMRSGRLVCIDIDGKNEGFDHASELGFLPPTVAETSKSGNGYHLFYRVDDDWDVNEGFALYRDHIGIVKGVDVRGTGCVYHYPTQRWNSRELVQLPAHLAQRLQQRSINQRRQMENIQKTLELDPEEIAMLHDELLTELKKPIPQGKRNNTLFAIGSQLLAAEVPGWEEKLGDRASQVGLDDEEIDKLLANIKKYGGE